ncbi:hypothetical protein FB451DRAFT_1174904 [Mycena latifolia]|nr:hypothetical protein FB451DRAFT_1174904 [Mycena latifolia]
MPRKTSIAQMRFKNTVLRLDDAVTTLEVVSDNLGTSFLKPISNTARSLLRTVQTHMFSKVHNSPRYFMAGTPRIAILGAGGMGKTCLARAILHHQDIIARYSQNRVYVACDAALNCVQLASLIGSHVGLKPGKDLTQAVIYYFTKGPSSLLILDNLGAQRDMQRLETVFVSTYRYTASGVDYHNAWS